jgi:hypothetical protein
MQMGVVHGSIQQQPESALPYPLAKLLKRLDLNINRRSTHYASSFKAQTR